MPHRKISDRLQAAVGLSAADRNLLSAVPKTIRSFADREVMVRGGDRAAFCTLLVDGFAIRQKIVAGKNQILAVYVPGDIPDLHALQFPIMDHELVSAGPTTAAVISLANLRVMLQRSYALTNAFWRDTLIDASIYREWVANVGARDASARVAHFLCELATRLEIWGWWITTRFASPSRKPTLLMLAACRSCTSIAPYSS
ncbi:Crp/Fnr family transcriptional regulator [Bradyrhizobium sp. 6(2017)]|uniref:Crp/Fnr family transcriptional regulator n=1 Tax=Bradyrhizobium sp. 6(2017) TaxID=1197460 RepID=UPI0013E12145|nr:Crp/Fnr family transcriptional regulator [Bradyrhizobium sp. 6(2017)]QIG91041.1 Crp/Fnr family transcriptional regulator [Bradyrhizobium sp. 6(2017)]